MLERHQQLDCRVRLQLSILPMQQLDDFGAMRGHPRRPPQEVFLPARESLFAPPHAGLPRLRDNPLHVGTIVHGETHDALVRCRVEGLDVAGRNLDIAHVRPALTSLFVISGNALSGARTTSAHKDGSSENGRCPQPRSDTCRASGSEARAISAWRCGGSIASRVPHAIVTGMPDN